MLEINLSPFPVLTTSRLKLPQLNADDEKEILAIRTDERISKFLTRPKQTTLEEARSFIDKVNSGISNNQAAYWGLTLKDDSPGDRDHLPLEYFERSFPGRDRV